MNKKTYSLPVIIVLILTISFVSTKFTKLKVNLDAANIHSLEYSVLDGGERKSGETTNKEDISKVIEYLNSLSLPKTSLRPTDGENSFYFKDDNGSAIETFLFGESGVLWVGSKTYKLGSSNVDNLKDLLIKIDK